MSAAFLVEIRHPGRRRKVPAGPGTPRETLAPTGDTRATTPRERRRRDGHRGAFRVDGTHTRSEANLRACPNCCTLTPPPQRNCSGANAPFWTVCEPPPTDVTSGSAGSIRARPRSRSPGDRPDRSARQRFYDRMSSRTDVPRTSCSFSYETGLRATGKRHLQSFFVSI